MTTVGLEMEHVVSVHTLNHNYGQPATLLRSEQKVLVYTVTQSDMKVHRVCIVC